MARRKFGDRPPPPLPWWRAEAVGIGVIAALGLPMVVDQFFHAMNVFPPTRSLIVETGDHVLAFPTAFWRWYSARSLPHASVRPVYTARRWGSAQLSFW